MATHHGEAGEYPRNVAGRRLISGFGPVLAALWVSGAAVGFWLAKWDVPIVGVCLLLTIAGLYATQRFVIRNLDANHRDWRHYARGMDGEKLVGWALDALGNEWHVFHGLQIREKQDLDHVLVGPGGMFYIQTKNWRGRITASGEALLHNGTPVQDAARVRGQAWALKQRLLAEAGISVRWINAILAVPFAAVDDRQQVANLAVMDLWALVSYIERQKPQFDRAQVESLVATLSQITPGDRRPAFQAPATAE